MDMTEDNDLLLRQFFQQTAQQQIADNGFTERVMQHLPQHASLTARRTLLTRLWTAFCIVVFAVLFVAFPGWELLAMPNFVAACSRCPRNRAKPKVPARGEHMP